MYSSFSLYLLFSVIGHSCKLRVGNTHECPQSTFHFQMDIIPKSELPSCTFSWTLGYLFENRTQMHMYSDQYINQENQFNYCVQQKQIYLDVVYGYELS